MKKILLSGLIIIILIIGVFLIRKSFSNKEQILKPVDSPNNSGVIVVESSRIKKLSDIDTSSYWIDNRENIFFISEEGQIFKNNQLIISSGITNINYVKLSSDGSRVAVANNYPSNPKISFFINNLGEFGNFSVEGSAMSWSPNIGSQLVYLADLGSESILTRYNFKTGEKLELLRLAEEDLEIEWILPDIVLLKERPSNRSQSSIWQYDIINKTIRSVVKDNYGFSIRWMPKTFLGLRLSNNKITIVDQYNSPLADLTIKTIPDKCTLGVNPPALYCASPNNTAGLNLPDDLFKENTLSSDGLYYAELPKPLIERFLPAGVIKMTPIYTNDFTSNNFVMENLQIKNNSLYFVNWFDKRLYSLELK